jgi:hypothetical protein
MDGDGVARPKFIFDTPEFQKQYEELKYSMKDVYEESQKNELWVRPEILIDML